MRIALIVLVLLIAALIGVFAWHNEAPLTVDLFFSRPSLPTALWLVGFFALGAVLGSLIPLLSLLRCRMRTRRLQRRVEAPATKH